MRLFDVPFRRVVALTHLPFRRFLAKPFTVADGGDAPDPPFLRTVPCDSSLRGGSTDIKKRKRFAAKNVSSLYVLQALRLTITLYPLFSRPRASVLAVKRVIWVFRHDLIARIFDVASDFFKSYVAAKLANGVPDL